MSYGPRVDLEEVVRRFDRVAANVAKLESVWERVQPMIPTSVAMGSPPEYDDLLRQWDNLRTGLPPVDGFTVATPLPNHDELGLAFIDRDAFESIPLFEAGERPGKELAEYKFRLNRARRKAIRGRLEELEDTVSILLAQIVAGIPRDSGEELRGERQESFRQLIAEIETLLGDTVNRSDRWGYLHRHMAWTQGQDWHDILEIDWPAVRQDLVAAMSSPEDPIDVPNEDLGQLAATTTGGVTVGLPWERLTDAGFETLLYDLVRSYPSHSNAQLLMRTNASDRGRDLSFQRQMVDDTGTVRVERIVVQAKHWLSKSVSVVELTTLLGQMSLWEPPTVHGLVVATTGRFTSDAVAFAERHNDKSLRPRLELWPDTHLETMLSQKPSIAAGHGLR